ncbi:uncharacterized protein IAS62_004481 [Cryptococcus decagattii]|uniref:Uncharacterized protein n=1 Tax=Cryptococcus decagattii TaxID=1859122 RepID=A0ABZ2B0G4_9TREE
MAVPPPPDLGRNTFIFRTDSSKQRRGLLSGKTQSGGGPHSQVQGSNNRASIPTPAETVGLGAAAGNHWGNEVPMPQIQILPEELLYAGPVRPYPVMYAPHKRGFWAKISDWWYGEPYQENPRLPRSTPKQHRPVAGLTLQVTPIAAMPYASLPPAFQDPASPPCLCALPRWEQKLIEKQQKAEMKKWKKMENEQKKLYKRNRKLITWEERKNLKAMGKELNKNQFNHVHIPFHNGQRRLPQVADHEPELPKPKSEPEEPKKEMQTSMILPPEEFGVRPFRGDGGWYDWPMMSRTMTHALKDLAHD